MSDSHTRQDVDGFIADLERELHEKKLTPPFGDHVPQGSPIPPDEYYITLSTYGLSIEVPNAEWSARMARALRENYGFSDREVRWFTMHAELDADHGAEFRRHARKVAEQPGGLERLREKTLAIAPVAKNIRNCNGSWKTLTS